MVMPSLQLSIYGAAKRLKRTPESVLQSPLKTAVMMTVLCDECGAQFAVHHPLASQDVGLAEQQAVWLKDRFVWDHIQEHKHSGSIPLPGSHQIKAAPVAR
jgi:hypothetical protein